MAPTSTLTVVSEGSEGVIAGSLPLVTTDLIGHPHPKNQKIVASIAIKIMALGQKPCFRSSADLTSVTS